MARPLRLVILFVFLNLVFCKDFFAQPKPARSRTDSLLRLLIGAKEDTQLIALLNNAAWAFKGSDPDTAIVLSTRAMKLSEKLSQSPVPEIAKAGLRGLGQSEKQIGALLQIKSDYQGALRHDSIAFGIMKRTGSLRGQAGVTNNMGIVYEQQGNFDKALECYKKALKIGEVINNKRDIALYVGNIGAVYMEKGDFVEALDYDQRALKMDMENENLNGIAVNLGNISANYDYLGNYPRAIDNAFKALKVNEEMGNKAGAANTLGNIGYFYSQQGDSTKALKYYKKALELAEALGLKNEIVRMYSNLSEILKAQQRYPAALNYKFHALQISLETENKHSLPQCYTGIGSIYESQGDSALEKGNREFAFSKKYPAAMEEYKKALLIANETGEKPAISFSYSSIGTLELKRGNYRKAEEWVLKGLAISISIKELDRQKDAHYTLSEIYEKTGEQAKSLLHYKRYTALKDSIFSLEKDKAITRKEMNYEFDKKESARKADQDQKDLLTMEERRRHLLAIYAGSAVVALLLVLAGLIYRSNLQKQKANLQLDRKNRLIEKQKELVEEQNKNILDSINYAKRIQEAMLPTALFSDDEVKDHFIFFAPKDVVSGDFYWRYETPEDLFFAVVDCTGHGVPGAMMSMMGYDVLESAMKDKNLREPAAILQEVNEQIIEKLNQNNSGGTRDGMDLIFCRLNKKTRTLAFAGAKNELWVCSGASLQPFSVDRHSIGDQVGLVFTQHEIVLGENDMIYLFTDGYVDQKGGAENRKYMKSQFKNLLTGISGLSCTLQREKLEAEFHAWKGSAKQRDDILIVGFRAPELIPS